MIGVIPLFSPNTGNKSNGCPLPCHKPVGSPDAAAPLRSEPLFGILRSLYESSVHIWSPGIHLIPGGLLSIPFLCVPLPLLVSACIFQTGSPFLFTSLSLQYHLLLPFYPFFCYLSMVHIMTTPISHACYMHVFMSIISVKICTPAVLKTFVIRLSFFKKLLQFSHALVWMRKCVASLLA